MTFGWRIWLQCTLLCCESLKVGEFLSYESVTKIPAQSHRPDRALISLGDPSQANLKDKVGLCGDVTSEHWTQAKVEAPEEKHYCITLMHQCEKQSHNSFDSLIELVVLSRSRDPGIPVANILGCFPAVFPQSVACQMLSLSFRNASLSISWTWHSNSYNRRQIFFNFFTLVAHWKALKLSRIWQLTRHTILPWGAEIPIGSLNDLLPNFLWHILGPLGAHQYVAA